MGPPGFQQAHANPFRSPLSVPLRRRPDWEPLTENTLIYQKGVSGFSQIGETLPLETLPETKLDLNS